MLENIIKLAVEQIERSGKTDKDKIRKAYARIGRILELVAAAHARLGKMLE